MTLPDITVAVRRAATTGWAILLTLGAPAAAWAGVPELAKLTASDAATGDEFGVAVSISGNTAIVGAYLDDHAGGTDAGAAYVYVRVGGLWTEQAKLTASDAAADDNFGVSVDIDGDTAVVGAFSEGFNNLVGAAYVFVRSGGAWTQQAKLIGSDSAVGDRFGRSVAIDGDTVVVTAY